MDVEQNGMHVHNGGHVHEVIYHDHRLPQRRRTGITKCFCQTLYLVRYFPFVMISLLFLWGVYVYLFYIIYQGYQSVLLKIILMLFFVPLYTLSGWSYIQTVFTTNRSIPDEFSIPESINLNLITEDEINHSLEHVVMNRNLPIYTRNFNGHIRYCRKCLVIKPDRCHHCSTCGKCIRKMDHHCHWVSNCVAFDNYKYFLQFLTYTVLLAVYTSATSLKLFIKFWKEEEYPGRFQIFFLVVFCSVFSVSILFLLSYHIYLVLKNMSTLEAYQPPRFKNVEQDQYRFNLGAYHNFRAIFGDNKWLWFVPISSSFGDGLQFDLRLKTSQFDKGNNLIHDANNYGHNHNSNGVNDGSSIMTDSNAQYYNQQDV
ncbi:Palmitoyltransferase zdhhc2 [Blomia tropicalis]|nr:Palmitoyltransferase zdhhc2 [Blomia tropicalis]